MPYFLIASRLFCHPCIREKGHKLTKNGRKWLSWDMEVLACFRPVFFPLMVGECAAVTDDVNIICGLMTAKESATTFSKASRFYKVNFTLWTPWPWNQYSESSNGAKSYTFCGLLKKYPIKWTLEILKKHVGVPLSLICRPRKFFPKCLWFF